MGRYIMLFIGMGFSAIYMVLYLAGRKKYSAAVANVNDDVFIMSDTFSVGLEIIDLFKINVRSTNIKTRQKYAELFDKQYIDFYIMITAASTISYTLLFLPMAFLFGAVSNEPVFTVLILLVPVILAVFTKLKIDAKIKEQHEQILLDYPNVLSKMALLINAGMILREAWVSVSESGSGKLYLEMQNATKKIENGYSDLQAYEELAEACKVNEIKKFVSIICQNVQKGSSELTHVLKELSVDAWTLKKNVAKMRGDNAGSKLIIPVMISFAAILMMIMVPIMTGMQSGF